MIVDFYVGTQHWFVLGEIDPLWFARVFGEWIRVSLLAEWFTNWKTDLLLVLKMWLEVSSALDFKAPFNSMGDVIHKITKRSVLESLWMFDMWEWSRIWCAPRVIK